MFAPYFEGSLKTFYAALCNLLALYSSFLKHIDSPQMLIGKPSYYFSIKKS